MGAKELRIGNYVKYFSDYEWSKITVLDHNYCHLNNASSIDYNEIQGVPLTEDILLKCGFENWYSNEYFLSNGFFYMNLKFYKNGNIKVTMCGESKKYFKGENMLIAKLHQLQNLYFSLTNEELTVNL